MSTTHRSRDRTSPHRASRRPGGHGAPVEEAVHGADSAVGPDTDVWLNRRATASGRALRGPTTPRSSPPELAAAPQPARARRRPPARTDPSKATGPHGPAEAHRSPLWPADPHGPASGCQATRPERPLHQVPTTSLPCHPDSPCHPDPPCHPDSACPPNSACPPDPPCQPDPPCHPTSPMASGPVVWGRRGPLGYCSRTLLAGAQSWAATGWEGLGGWVGRTERSDEVGGFQRGWAPRARARVPTASWNGPKGGRAPFPDTERIEPASQDPPGASSSACFPAGFPAGSGDLSPPCPAPALQKSEQVKRRTQIRIQILIWDHPLFAGGSLALR